MVRHTCLQKRLSLKFSNFQWFPDFFFTSANHVAESLLSFQGSDLPLPAAEDPVRII